MNEPARDASDVSPIDVQALPLPLDLIDTHAHLDQDDFDADRGQVIARAREAGVRQMICPAVSAASSDALQRLSMEHELFCAVGIHPNSTTEAQPGDWEQIVALSNQPRVVALGETGLDRYWDYAPLPLQEEYLEKHLQLAHERDLPVILHCRDAQEDLLRVLRRRMPQLPFRGILHAFSGDTSFAAACLDLGLFISFAGNVTYSNKKFDSLRTVAKMVPAERLLVETDSPYLTPQRYRGKLNRNEPVHVMETATFLAALRGTSLDQLAAATSANARRLFRLP